MYGCTRNYGCITTYHNYTHVSCNGFVFSELLMLIARVIHVGEGRQTMRKLHILTLRQAHIQIIQRIIHLSLFKIL